MEVIRVGISELKVSNSLNSLKTSGLGSCIAILMYDKFNKIGGLSHIILPYSYDFKQNHKEEKFADTAIPLLFLKMIEEGAEEKNIVSAIFGGSNMFNILETKTIGEKNIESSIQKLKELNIDIKFQDLGGNKGRTVLLNCETGIISLKTVSFEEKIFQF